MGVDPHGRPEAVANPAPRRRRLRTPATRPVGPHPPSDPVAERWHRGSPHQVSNGGYLGIAAPVDPDEPDLAPRLPWQREASRAVARLVGVPLRRGVSRWR